jgi:hypothetical protein
MRKLQAIHKQDKVFCGIQTTLMGLNCVTWSNWKEWVRLQWSRTLTVDSVEIARSKNTTRSVSGCHTNHPWQMVRITLCFTLSLGISSENYHNGWSWIPIRLQDTFVILKPDSAFQRRHAKSTYQVYLKSLKHTLIHLSQLHDIAVHCCLQKEEKQVCPQDE